MPPTELSLMHVHSLFEVSFLIQWLRDASNRRHHNSPANHENWIKYFCLCRDLTSCAESQCTDLYATGLHIDWKTKWRMLDQTDHFICESYFLGLDPEWEYPSFIWWNMGYGSLHSRHKIKAKNFNRGYCYFKLFLLELLVFWFVLLKSTYASAFWWSLMATWSWMRCEVILLREIDFKIYNCWL